MSLKLENVVKQYGLQPAIHQLSLEIQPGELVALLGPSGCGKTTLLRSLAGLESLSGGRIWFGDQEASQLSVQERRVGFVFQHYALFRHMTVFENVAFGLRVRPKHTRPNDAEIKRRVHELLNLVQLDWLADRYPPQLSGGQRQRIALARALAVEPKVLLLDEPFGALDAKVRKELRRWLRRLHDELHVTSVFVTHDQEEALEVADTIVVMNQGKIEQIGTPQQVYDNPATPFVYQFLGNVNAFEGRVNAGVAKLGALEVPVKEFAQTNDSAVQAFARPHDIDISRDASAAAFRAQLTYIHSAGSVVRLELKRDDAETFIEAELTREYFSQLNLKEGETVYLTPRNVRFFLD